MSSAELESFYLSKDKYYDILNITDYNKKKYFQESFQDTLEVLNALDFKLHQKSDIFQVLALLIHMGNIKFREDDEICVIDFNNNSMLCKLFYIHNIEMRNFIQPYLQNQRKL